MLNCVQHIFMFTDTEDNSHTDSISRYVFLKRVFVTCIVMELFFNCDNDIKLIMKLVLQKGHQKVALQTPGHLQMKMMHWILVQRSDFTRLHVLINSLAYFAVN